MLQTILRYVTLRCCNRLAGALAHVSVIFVFLFAKIFPTTETFSPQTFSVTAAVVAPAVLICLNSLCFLECGKLSLF